MARLEELARELSEALDAPITRDDDGTYTIEVEIEDEDGPPLLLSLYADQLPDSEAAGLPLLVCRAEGGELREPSEAVDLLELAGSAWFSRIYVDDESRNVVVEAALPESSDLATIAAMVWEVAELTAEASAHVGD